MIDAVKMRIKKILLIFSGVCFVFFMYVSCLHLIVYGFKYVTLRSNLHIMVTRPECTYTFLTPDSLKNKFSYKLLTWIEEARPADPATKAVIIPGVLMAEYFSPGESVSVMLKKVKCEFPKMKKFSRDGENYIGFAYIYKVDEIAARHISIVVHVIDNNVTDIDGYLSWGIGL
ncbi:hypothetical protein NW564_004324 [Salmonella enterica]|nr:hypothetical protein [Salmonella enterica]